MAGLFENLKKWAGAITGGSKRDNETADLEAAIVNFAKTNGLLGRPFSIPTREGDKLSRALVVSVGDNEPKIYVGDDHLKGMVNSTNRRGYSNLETDSWNMFNIDSIGTDKLPANNIAGGADKEEVLHRVAERITFHHDYGGNGIGKFNAATDALVERLRSIKPLNNEQSKAIHDYLIQYSEMGISEHLSRLKYRACRNGRVGSEISAELDHIVDNIKAETSSKKTILSAFAVQGIGNESIDFKHREMMFPDGAVLHDNNSLYIDDKMSFFKKDSLSSSEIEDYSLDVEGIKFKDGNLDSVKISYMVDGYNNPTHSLVPYSELSKDGKTTVLDHLAKYIILNRTESPENREFTDNETAILAEYARQKGATDDKSRLELFDGLIDSLQPNTRKLVSFSRQTSQEWIEKSKEGLHDLSYDIDYNPEARLNALEALEERLNIPVAPSLTAEQSDALYSFLSNNKRIGGDPDAISKLFDDAINSVGRSPEREAVRAEIEDFVKFYTRPLNGFKPEDMKNVVPDSYKGMSEKDLLALVDKNVRSMTTMSQLTLEQSRAVRDSDMWKKWTPQQLAAFQASQPYNVVDMTAYKAAASRILGRTVMFHEIPTKELSSQVTSAIQKTAKPQAAVSTDAGKKVGKGWAGLINGAGGEKTATVAIGKEQTPVSQQAPQADAEKTLHDNFEELMKESEKEEQSRGIKR